MAPRDDVELYYCGIDVRYPLPTNIFIPVWVIWLFLMFCCCFARGFNERQPASRQHGHFLMYS